MEKVLLSDLKFKTREETVGFLKKLWNEEETNCVFCNNKLEELHKKKKKNNCDWKCSNCNKVYRSIDLLYELNSK